MEDKELEQVKIIIQQCRRMVDNAKKPVSEMYSTKYNSYYVGGYDDNGEVISVVDIFLSYDSPAKARRERKKLFNYLNS